MSVYTSLSLKQVQDFASAFSLDVLELIPIQGGIQNTNYFLRCADADYVLTLFEDMSAEQAAEIIPALDQLVAQGVAVPAPLKINGQALHVLADKPAQITPRVLGEHPETTTVAQVRAIAQAQARMHLALKDFPLTRQFNRNHDYWYAVAKQLQPQMSTEDAALLQQLIERFAEIRQQYPDRPRGLIHSDLFRDNTLFIGDDLQGILDFYEMNHDELLFDVAISINDFCSDYPDVSLNDEKAAAFLEAYQQLRPFTADEQACLDSYLAAMAGRFWLLRLSVVLKNQQQGRDGEQILVKDPEVMRHMVLNRLARL
ncbi:homoserine kinase [Acinetobacter larvae]|uniref:Homoserine kinase n=1 Tax=Acinetobacter larvae TaxID=1789224 RepID=A0A1B2LW15_9GAMM|nr:homoserine kinase [Acinetobacter larvae]AOA57124.1 homoserine kinase [Acinetobacter larvae]